MTADAELTALSASEAAARIRAGSLTSEALVRACLDRIAAREPVVHAWAWVDPEAALAAARVCDAQAPRGPLHGVPVGLKDVIDTADMPTEFGSEAFAGHVAERDAACVAALRAAGAVIMGKLVTAEFATYRPGPTANPLNPGHTPGGSSSGSAAAVADRHVPLALGTQTAGSVIRPASFCGIHGFKPTFGRYSNDGVIATAHRLDTLGSFARTVEDLLLLDAVLGDATDPPAPVPVVGLYRSEAWEEASPAMQAALEETAARLRAAGYDVIEIAATEPFAKLAEAQAIIHKHEAWQCLGEVRRTRADMVSQIFRDFIDEGERISTETYASACGVQDACKADEAVLFGMTDVLLTPGAPGIAPEGLSATGNPRFNRAWTALGTPCLGFPGGSEAGLPLGLQFVGRSSSDRALLRQGVAMLAALA
nr:B128 [uncultured bacterium]